MTEQFIITPEGERMVVISERDYRALLDARDDADDRVAVRQFKDRMKRGEEELLPAAMVDAILNGENRIRVWREHRGLSASALAKAAGIAAAYLSQIETGKRDGTIETYRKLAEVLRVSLDDLVG
jgi:DNA-binding XRE family transcriptional regulator